MAKFISILYTCRLVPSATYFVFKKLNAGLNYKYICMGTYVICELISFGKLTYRKQGGRFQLRKNDLMENKRQMIVNYKL